MEKKFFSYKEASIWKRSFFSVKEILLWIFYYEKKILQEKKVLL